MAVLPDGPGVPCCAGFHQMFAFYSANQYFYDDMVELDMNIQSASTTTNLTVNNSTTVAGQAVTFTGARACASVQPCKVQTGLRLSTQ